MPDQKRGRKLMFYPNLLKKIRDDLQEAYPNVTITMPGMNSDGICKDNTNKVAHLLYMALAVESMKTNTTESAVDAALYVGWMMRMMEELGLWTNMHSRTYVRIDMRSRLHLPT